VVAESRFPLPTVPIGPQIRLNKCTRPETGLIIFIEQRLREVTQMMVHTTIRGQKTGWATVLVAVAALFTFPVMAQEGEQPETVGTPPLLETIDVRVINVDAVVTDRRGNPITGLTIDDFEIYENGRPQRITNFYEVNDTRIRRVTRTSDDQEPVEHIEETTPAERPPQMKRKIVFFVDNVSLHPFNRNRVFRAFQDFVDEAMQEGDEAMIATWNRSMKIRVPFTSERQFLKQEFQSLAGESALGNHYVSEKRALEDRVQEARSLNEAIMDVRSWAMSVEHDLRQTVHGVNGLLENLAGVDGKKIMVMTSEGFHIQPGREMFYYIEEVRREKSAWGGDGGGILLQGMSFDSTSLIRSIATTANANDITLYTIHAGGLVGMESVSASRANPVSLTVQQQAYSNSSEALQLMADMTGGLATVGTNNFRGAMERIERDLTSYYSLGYRSITQRIDAQRSIEVRTKDRQFRVRSKRSFVEKSIETEMSDKVVANVLFEVSENDLGVILRTNRPRQIDRDIYEVPLDILIPIDSLTLLPLGTAENRGSFSVWIVVQDERGDLSEVQNQNHVVLLTNEQLASLRGRHYVYDLRLRMRGGFNKISVGVVDEGSRTTGFRQQRVNARILN
jgi:VWFA-related protein